MSDNGQDDAVPLLRQLRIIVAALIAGCLLFLAIALVFAGPPNAERQPILTYVALAFAAMAVVSRIVMVGAVVATGRRGIARGLPPSAGGGLRHPPREPPPDDLVQKLRGLFTVRTIAGAAILEGATLFLGAAYFVEGFWPAPAAAGLLIVGLLLHLPTRAGLARWTEAQRRLLDEERQMGA